MISKATRARWNQDDRLARRVTIGLAYQAAEETRQSEERAKVDKRTQQMLDAHRQTRVSNAKDAAYRLKAAVEQVLKALQEDDIRAAGFATEGLAGPAGIIADNLKQVEAVDDALEIIKSEGAE